MQDLTITDDLWEYMRRVTLREPDVLRKLREETARLPNSNLQISAEQGQFMALLMHLIGARRTIEIGVYTGYSALSTALAIVISSLAGAAIDVVPMVEAVSRIREEQAKEQ